ncbi:guanosine monophosphate reductase [Halocalculus aciditolerans]|uniref:Guanosine monophosphate reductase n=1 Tax=Halocalculus aciditolerans TaxID=1383812 RepID=A0A830F9N6_9EURY|nr:IMP dehydrogenase [Halocalculus aciditolerans]GGL53417.1 guanosine monophosphate reductase [Halocalculus aciditolerans]
MNVRTGLSYGDVLVVPQRSPVDSRSDVSLETELAPGLTLDAPVLSAPMDSVTEADAAIELSRLGGLGVVHRFLPVEKQAAEVEAVVDAGEQVAAALGIAEDHTERAQALVDAGVDALVLDVAHGHMEAAIDVTRELAGDFPDTPLVSGNVATKQGVHDLADAGADCVKVGIGPGSHCTTREVAGAGVPQFTAVTDAAEAADEAGVTTIADGGIQTSGDAVKALVGGADAVMMGGFFMGTPEAPGETVEVDGVKYKRTRGMSTGAAMERREDKDGRPDADEGVESMVALKRPLETELREFLGGVRSGVSYCGAHTLDDARENSEFIRLTPEGKARSGAHGVARSETTGRSD